MAAERIALQRTIYSVGYEGLTLEQLLRRLGESHVTTLVDVRMTAASRRPGFSKRRLQVRSLVRESPMYTSLSLVILRRIERTFAQAIETLVVSECEPASKTVQATRFDASLN